MSLLGNHYGHCEKEILLGSIAGAGEAVGSATDLFKQLAAQAVDGGLTPQMIDAMWEQLKHRVAQHALTNYCTLIAALTTKSSAN